jgi:hypothetical protein
MACLTSHKIADSGHTLGYRIRKPVVSEMESTTAPNDIVLFNYPSSPFGKRISWYLQLRKIGFALCVSMN